jgi:hypothetical protein
MNKFDQKYINLAKEYQLQRSNRGLGLTTSIIEAVGYCNGTMIVHTKAMAEDIKRHYPKTDVKAYNENMFKGVNKPVFLDNHLEFIMIQALLGRIDELEKEVKKNEIKRNPK